MIDPARLSAWFEAHAARLVLYARQICGPRAQDVVQEAFVSLMQEAREPGNVRSWLYRAVRNGAISATRSDQARVRRHEALAKLSSGWFEPKPDDLIDAAAAQQCLEGLPPARREVIVLRIWSDLSFPEIGELTGLAVSTVFDHYRAGLAAIRKQMESTCHANRKTTN